MASAIPIREGRVPFRGYQVWYRIAGDKEAPGRLSAIRTLGAIGPAAADAVPALTELTKEKNITIRKQAQAALGQIKSK